MRLAQIARKLKVKPTEVVTFIKQNFQVQLPSTPNTKIPDEYVDGIIEHFTPVNIETAKRENPISTEEKITQTSDNEILEVTKEIVDNKVQEDEETSLESITSEKEGIETKDTESIEEKPSEEIVELNIEDGVIKAPKVEIEGVKVVGKIELPSNKVETEVVENDLDFHQDETLNHNSAESTTEEIIVPKEKPRRKKPKQKQKKSSSISYEGEVSESQQAYKEELRKKRELEKKKKTENYERLMQRRLAKKPKKKAKKKNTQQEKRVQIQKQKAEAPKSLWKKFIYWLNN